MTRIFLAKSLVAILLFQLIAPQTFALTTSIDFTNTSDYVLEDSTKVELSEGKLQLSGGDTTETVEDVFSTYLYEGNGSTQTVENGIDLEGEGGMVWIKNRTNDNSNILIDTERGPEYRLISDGTQSSYADSAI